MYVCLCVCVFGCVTACVVLNLFELLTSKIKMKFSDVQVKGENSVNLGKMCASVCVCDTASVHA